MKEWEEFDYSDDEKLSSWVKLPKIIDNDGISTDDEESESEDGFDIVRSNGEHILFRRLGYCALDSNERANYKARELKAVRLDAEGEYIRLVARRCYDNHLNQYNQVGIVGITVMGEPANYLLAGESQTIPFEHADEGLSRVASPETCIVPFIQENFTSLYSILPNSAPNNSSSTNATTPLPDNDQIKKSNNPITANDFLSNGEETEQLLAAIGRAKQSAVKVEDFNLAKVLKYCTELVKKASGEVIKFDKLKKQAVEEEDFDNADKYKNEVESIRAEVRGILADEGIDLDDSGEVIVCDSLQDIIGLADDAENVNLENQQPGVPSGNEHQLQQDNLYANSAHVPKNRSNSNASIDRASGARAPEPMFPKSRTNSDASVNRFIGDDKPLPKAEAMLVYPSQNELDDEPTLSDLARSAFSLSISFFGENVVAWILSKRLTSRKSALIDITKRIDIDGDGLNVEGIDKLMLVKATYQVMQEALDDDRENLVLHVLNLWEKLIKFCVHHQISNSSTWKLVDSHYELLFSKIADSNDNIKQGAINLFVLLARTYRTPTQSVLSLILKPAKTSSQSLRKAKPTIDIIIRLIEEFGIVKIPKVKFDKDNKLSFDIVMEISLSYLNNSNLEVGEAAAKLVFEVIKRMGREMVIPFLEEVKPVLLESILNLLTEWESTTGNIAGEEPKKPVGDKTFEIDENLLQKPLAKRGTVGRMEQQLMELRHMMNGTNHIIKDEVDDYLASTTKSFHQELDEEEEALAAEIAALEAEEERQAQAQAQTQKSKTATSSKKPQASRDSKPTSGKAPSAKRSKDDGKAAPTSKKTSASTAKPSSKTKSGSTDDKPKGVRKNSVTTQSKMTAEPEKISDDPDESKGCCIFCDEQDERFTEDNLVNHYWNDCPVLTNCRLCNMILEISTLDDHMLNDCDKSKFVKQCPRCREVIEADDYLEHMAKQSCIAIRQDIVRCPLCKTVVKPATEQGWKSHLIDENGCTKNRRKTRSAATSMVKEMEAAATAERREKKSTSTSKSSAASKAPTRKQTAASKDKPKKPSSSSTTKVLKAKK